MIYRKVGKRLFDIILSGLGLLLLSPVFLVVSILVRVNLGKPILFKQVRPGFEAKPFTMFKFRTMKDTRDSNGNLMSDELRLTKFGNFLRSTSLDELPELWNVLKGEMSIVGPRPLLMEYLPLYSDDQFRRHEVKPGITGLAQIKGRNSISFDDKVTFDLEYLSLVGFFKDIEIIVKTVITVFMKKGIDGNELDPRDRRN